MGNDFKSNNVKEEIKMGHGKGAIPYRKVAKILKDNGYREVRFNGHHIYENDEGNTIAIPKTCCTYVVQREFKKNGIKM